MTSIQTQDEHRTPPVYSYASKEGLESDGSDHEPDEYTSLLAASVPPATGNLGNRSVSSLLDRYRSAKFTMPIVIINIQLLSF